MSALLSPFDNQRGSKHARLSASSGHRWLICAGSVGEGSGPSFYSAEGTFAHDIAAKCLNDSSVSPSDFLCKRENVDGFEIECGLEMVSGVQLYVNEMDDRTLPGDLCWVEMPLLAALQTVDKDLGGTADYVRYRKAIKHLLVADFKYGAGRYVEAVDNKQAKIYAVGALREVQKQGLLVAEIEVVIVQPRYEGAKPVRSWTFKAVELLDFIVDLQEAAARTREPNPPLVTGEHCEDYCPKARTCPALTKSKTSLMAAKFEVALPYSPAALAQALTDIPLVKAQIKAVEEFAYAEANAGRFGLEHGFKLVDKEPRRKWKDEAKVIEFAKVNNLDPYAPPEVLSPAQLEKQLSANAPRGKKKEAVKVLEPLYEKVSSGTALVPISDDRAPAKLRVTGADFVALPAAPVNPLLTF